MLSPRIILSRCAGTVGRDSVLPVWITLPCNGAIRLHFEILVLDANACWQSHSRIPKRITGRVLGCRQWNGIRGAPIAELRDVASQEDVLAVRCGFQLVKCDRRRGLRSA